MGGAKDEELAEVSGRSPARSAHSETAVGCSGNQERENAESGLPTPSYACPQREEPWSARSQSVRRSPERKNNTMLVQDVTSETALPNGHLPERDLAPAAHASTPSLFSLADSTIIVTGGGRGIGQALAKGIAEAGGSVACLDVLPEPTNGDGEWDAIKKGASKNGASASYHVCDITNEELMLETFNKIEKVHKGTVRGVVAGAGVQQMVPAIDYPMDGFRRIMEIK